MLLVMDVLSVVLRPFAAVSTRDTLLLMPFARLLMKSGIQLSIEARGPSSGTEKCRKDRILLATEDTADVTDPIAPRMPDAMLFTRSEPQEAAEEITLVTAVFALLKPLVIAVLMLVILLEMLIAIF